MNPAAPISSAPINYNPPPERCADPHQFFQSFLSDFQPVIDFLMQDADVFKLLGEIVEVQGEKINLKFDLQQQPASYNFNTHTIVLSTSLLNSSLQEQVIPLFFELQNARQCRNFQQLSEQVETLEKDEYVKQFEEYEYNSALATYQFVQKYVAKGIFTQDAPYFYKPLNFNDAYLLQQLTGHAQNIAVRTGRLVNKKKPYRGTWPCPLTEPQIPFLKALLFYKIVLETPQGATEEEKKEAQKKMTELMNEIDSIYHDNPRYAKALWKNAHEVVIK